ncbi:MAG: Thymidylate kinase [Parcubacteria group bacterium GW2011_GWC2_39_14]|nr:MAG: Thymidylate kinase [Parcubacteria group bacterium GW2011_GWC2_39_14]KKR55107.1 MAG: Thymidylate kinase [Parcubacteria group bacterium GW2011_GWA2_40_23]
MENFAGKFIVIDGTDGSGKTTQFNFLIETLKNRGFAVEIADFPQYNTKSAGLVEEYLSGKYGSADEVKPKISSIFYACDRYDASFKIRKWLQEGKIVVSNRYVSANMGHQGAKIADPAKRKEFFDWLYDLEYNLFGIPQPDLNIILHVESKIAQQLAQQRQREDWVGKTKDIHEENLNHLLHAEQTYLEIAKYPNFKLIECTRDGQIMSREEIQTSVWQEVERLIRPPQVESTTTTNKDGWIEVICGCMFSGKSTEAAKRITKELISKNREILIFVPQESSREITLSDSSTSINTSGKLVSRNGKIFSAIEFPKDQPSIILQHIESQNRPITTVVIEEAHFCHFSLVQVCKRLAEDYKLRVIVVGLDQTFDDEGFGPMPALMVEAEFVTKELAVCVKCGSQTANKSWLDRNEREQLEGKILVGDSQYIALCRHCKNKFKKQT